jgi:hypothetical protein
MGRTQRRLVPWVAVEGLAIHSASMSMCMLARLAMGILSSSIFFSAPGEHIIRFYYSAVVDSDSMNAEPATSEHDSDVDSSAVAEVEKLLRSPASEKRRASQLPSSPPAGTGYSPSRHYTPCAFQFDGHLLGSQANPVTDASLSWSTEGPVNIRALEIFLEYASPCVWWICLPQQFDADG